MLNLDTHILIFLLDGNLDAREHQLVARAPLAISAIVLWELAKLVQLGAPPCRDGCVRVSHQARVGQRSCPGRE